MDKSAHHGAQPPRPIPIRRAQPEDVDAVAVFYRRVAGAEWPFLYPHTPEEDRAFFAEAFRAGVVWLATGEDGALAGFCAARRGWIDHLFVDHHRHGQGIGRALLAQALKGRRRVRLWTFQRNTGARAFYAAQGFRAVRLTDGAHNEEREPDVQLEWVRD